MTVRCPRCGKEYPCDQANAGEVFQCSGTGCGTMLRIPRQALSSEPKAVPQPKTPGPPKVINAGSQRRRLGRVALVSAALAAFGFFLYIVTVAPKPPAPAQSSPSRPTKPPSCVDGKAAVSWQSGHRVFPDKDAGGDSTLTIENGTQWDAIIRLTDVFTSKTTRVLYVARRQNYTIRRIEDGSDYWVYYGLGAGWVNECFDFKQGAAFGEFDRPVFFKLGYHSEFTLTLYKVPFGNAPSTAITRQEFLSGWGG